MTDRYLLIETDYILAEFCERQEAFDLMEFMQCRRPDSSYQLISEDDLI